MFPLTGCVCGYKTRTCKCIVKKSHRLLFLGNHSPSRLVVNSLFSIKALWPVPQQWQQLFRVTGCITFKKAVEGLLNWRFSKVCFPYWAVKAVVQLSFWSHLFYYPQSHLSALTGTEDHKQNTTETDKFMVDNLGNGAWLFPHLKKKHFQFSVMCPCESITLDLIIHRITQWV